MVRWLKILSRKYLKPNATGLIFGFILSLPLSFFLLSRLNPKQVLSNSPSLSNPNQEASPQEKEVAVINEPVTILILGLDARRGDYRPRCDAIHLITFSPEQEKIIITSVPRGIYVDLPNIATASAYLGNSCHIKGIDFAVAEIEKITQLQPDYLIKINFSQTLGILRFLGLPTTPTLQFLRDRRSYYYGDLQRSHNQALFIKEMLLNHLNQVASLPQPAKYLLFKIVKTESLDFETANSILNWIVKNNFSQKPDRIELITKPTPFNKLKDINFVEGKFSDKNTWQNDQEFQEYQQELKSYLQNLIDQGNKYFTSGDKDSAYQLLNTPFSQQLWLQLEDEKLRNNFHFELLKLYVLSSPESTQSSQLVSDFTQEMEIGEDDELKKKAEELLENLKS